MKWTRKAAARPLVQSRLDETARFLRGYKLEGEGGLKSLSRWRGSVSTLEAAANGVMWVLRSLANTLICWCSHARNESECLDSVRIFSLHVFISIRTSGLLFVFPCPRMTKYPLNIWFSMHTLFIKEGEIIIRRKGYKYLIKYHTDRRRCAVALS